MVTNENYEMLFPKETNRSAKLNRNRRHIHIWKTCKKKACLF